MPAPKGNRFWKKRSSHGRAPIFSEPAKLEQACEEYFEWAEDNPLWENKATQYQGAPVDIPIAKMRAMTIVGMCIFLDISEDTWNNYRNKEDFFGVTKRAEQIIYAQKFSGAAADLLNANIIARDLGLKDLSKSEHSGPNGGPIQLDSVFEFVPVSSRDEPSKD